MYHIAGICLPIIDNICLVLFQLFITIMDKLRLEIRAMDEVRSCSESDSGNGYWKNIYNSSQI